MMDNNTTEVWEETNGGEDITLEILLLVVYFINVFIHAFGIYLLAKLYKRNNDNLATLYLLNLSMSELTRNVLKIIEGPIFRSLVYNDHEVLGIIVNQIRLISATSVEFLFYGSMFSLTLNRLFEIALNIRYPVFWNLQKGKQQLIAMWILGVVLYIVLAIIDISDVHLLYNTILLVYIILDIVYLVIGISTYAFIFRQYVSAVLPPHDRRSSSAIPISRFKIFRESRFFLCAILVGKFLILVVLSDLISYFLDFLDNHILTVYNQICLTLSDFSDALIYIFFDPKVKELMKKQFKGNTGRLQSNWRSAHRERSETAF